LRRDLQPGDIISNASGATRFILKTVTPQSDGVYKGLLWFWMEIWNVKFLCEYWDLSVNTDNVMIGGDYESVYNPQFLLDVDEAKRYVDSLANAINDLTSDGLPPNAVRLNFTIPENPEYYYDDESGVLVIYDSDGNPHTVELPKKEDGTVDLPATIVDKNGKVYEVKQQDGKTVVDLANRQQRGSERKDEEYDLDIYYIIKKLNSKDEITAPKAENIVKTTAVEEYYTRLANIILEEGKYICIPVRKNIQYTCYNMDENKYDTIVKKRDEFIPYISTDEGSVFKPLSWSENPYNRYTISRTVNGNTLPLAEDVNYIIMDITEGHTDSLYIVPYVIPLTTTKFGAWNKLSMPDKLKEESYKDLDIYIDPYISLYHSGILKIAVEKHDIETVWFDKYEWTYDGSFGFDRYNELTLGAFKDKYESLEIVKPDGSKIDYRVPAISMWTNQSVTVKAKINENSALGDSVYYRFVTNNGLIIEHIRDDKGSSYPNGEFKNKNGNYELEVTLKSSDAAKGALLVKDKNEKTVGKLNFYSEKKENNNLIKYKTVNVAFGNSASKSIDMVNYVSGSPLENYLNNYSFNQAFMQFKSGGSSMLEIDSALIANNPIKFIENRLENTKENKIAVQILLETKYKESGGKIGENERVFFLINNQQMVDVGGFAPKPDERTNEGYSIVIFPSDIDIWETFVHEAGHTFSLRHPFEISPQYRQESTTNFMDYSLKKDMFWQWQWAIINSTDF
jgi:hypothetical protein